MERQPKKQKKSEDEDSSSKGVLSNKTEDLAKKVEEIGDLCNECVADSQIAVVGMTKDGQELFSFGHPNADAVIDRYIGTIPAPELGRYKHLQQLDSEASKNVLDELLDTPIDGMDLAELESYDVVLSELRRKVFDAMVKKSDATTADEEQVSGHASS